MIPGLFLFYCGHSDTRAASERQGHVPADSFRLARLMGGGGRHTDDSAA